MKTKKRIRWGALVVGLVIALVPATIIGGALALGGLPTAGMLAGVVVFGMGLDIVFNGSGMET